jgi:hypothetical protein
MPLSFQSPTGESNVTPKGDYKKSRKGPSLVTTTGEAR